MRDAPMRDNDISLIGASPNKNIHTSIPLYLRKVYIMPFNYLFPLNGKVPLMSSALVELGPLMGVPGCHIYIYIYIWVRLS